MSDKMPKELEEIVERGMKRIYHGILPGFRSEYRRRVITDAVTTAVQEAAEWGKKNAAINKEVEG